MEAKQGTALLVAQLIGGPFDGLEICLMTDEWPEFYRLPLRDKFPRSRSAQKQARHNGELRDTRMAQYRFERSASGKPQYVFDRRYNR